MTIFCLHAFGYLMKFLFMWSMIEAINGKATASIAVLSVSILVSQVVEFTLM